MEACPPNSKRTPQAINMNNTSAGIIIVGNELLNGTVQDQNTSVLASFFHGKGYIVGEVAIVRDNIIAITDIANRFKEQYTYFCIAGGIGPTHDDITREAIAQVFGVPLVHHVEMAQYLHDNLNHISGSVRKTLAHLPAGTRIHANNGRWPLIVIKNCFLLPGFPRGIQAVLTKMDAAIPACPPFCHADIFVSCGEGTYRNLLSEAQRQFPAVDIGSYPATTTSDWKCRIRLESKNKTHLQTVFSDLTEYFSAQKQLLSSHIG